MNIIMSGLFVKAQPVILPPLPYEQKAILLNESPKFSLISQTLIMPSLVPTQSLALKIQQKIMGESKLCSDFVRSCLWLFYRTSKLSQSYAMYCLVSGSTMTPIYSLPGGSQLKGSRGSNDVPVWVLQNWKCLKTYLNIYLFYYSSSEAFWLALPMLLDALDLLAFYKWAKVYSYVYYNCESINFFVPFFSPFPLCPLIFLGLYFYLQRTTTVSSSTYDEIICLFFSINLSTVFFMILSRIIMLQTCMIFNSLYFLVNLCSSSCLRSQLAFDEVYSFDYSSRSINYQMENVYLSYATLSDLICWAISCSIDCFSSFFRFTLYIQI